MNAEESWTSEERSALDEKIDRALEQVASGRVFGPEEARRKLAALREVHLADLATSVHFSPDVETRLQQVASATGKDAEQLVKDTVAHMLENQANFIAGVQRGIEQADRGEFVEHKDVLNRIDRLFHS